MVHLIVDSEAQAVVDFLKTINIIPKSIIGKVVTIEQDLSSETQKLLMDNFSCIKTITNSPWPLVAAYELPDKGWFDDFVLMAGPCAVESRQQMYQVSEFLSGLGVKFMRAGAFKPRTSPYDFQGLGIEGLEIFAEAAKKHGLLTVSEVMSVEDINIAKDYIDILQVGARNMQNTPLLKALGKVKKTVLLKRSAAANYKEFLLSAEYLLAHGNEDIILCERGIKTFESMTRNTLDISCVPLIKEITNIPIIVDPSHAVGISAAVPSLARAAVAAGAAGLMIEVHPEPLKSISDPLQAMSFADFANLVPVLNKIYSIVKNT